MTRRSGERPRGQALERTAAEARHTATLSSARSCPLPVKTSHRAERLARARRGGGRARRPRARARSAAESIGRELKVPGFRKGKVPPQVVLQQRRPRGRARRGRAARAAGLVRARPWRGRASPRRRPEVDLSDLPEKGSPLAFTFEVACAPRPSSAITRASRSAAASREVDRGGGRRRARPPARVARVARDRRTARPATGDYVVIDFVGTVDGEPFEGGEARGFLLELGSGRLVPGFEEQLEGASAGDERDGQDHLPRRLPGRAPRRQAGDFDVTSRRSRRSAARARRRLRGRGRWLRLAGRAARGHREAPEGGRGARRSRREFREAVVDAAVDRLQDGHPPRPGHAKAHEMWHQTAPPALAARAWTPRATSQLTGKTEEELVDRGRARGRARAAPRGGARRDRRGRGHRGDRRGAARGAARGHRARARASAGRAEGRSRARQGRGRATSRSARTSRCARPWTSWWSAPSRSRPSRRRRARSSGRPRRRARGGPGALDARLLAEAAGSPVAAAAGSLLTPARPARTGRRISSERAKQSRA